MIMVVQAETAPENENAFEVIQVPAKLPDEIIKNDSFLAIESNLNKLEDKVVITARSMLSMTNELKTQIFEIQRLEKNIIEMHEFMVVQNERISDLEKQVGELKNLRIEKKANKNNSKGFWARLFSW